MSAAFGVCVVPASRKPENIVAKETIFNYVMHITTSVFLNAIFNTVFFYIWQIFSVGIFMHWFKNFQRGADLSPVALPASFNSLVVTAFPNGANRISATSPTGLFAEHKSKGFQKCIAFGVMLQSVKRDNL